jgi:hypothetical protein
MCFKLLPICNFSIPYFFTWHSWWINVLKNIVSLLLVARILWFLL